MAGVRLAGVKWNGLDSFKHELEVMGADLSEEAGAILQESAEAARADIAAAYPVRKGGLRRGLVIRPSRGITLAGAELIQTAPHGHLYERGTKVRYNKAGAHRGQMDSTPTFVPIAAAYRRTAITQIMYRLYAHGATRVEGDAEE